MFRHPSVYIPGDVEEAAPVKEAKDDDEESNAQDLRDQIQAMERRPERVSPKFISTLILTAAKPFRRCVSKSLALWINSSRRNDFLQMLNSFWRDAFDVAEPHLFPAQALLSG